MKMIEAIDKFIIYMLTENDEEKIIYSKLNELEGEELEEWVNDKLKNYLANGCDYEEGDIVIENCDINCNWSLKDCIDFEKLFTNCSELLQIQKELIEYNNDNGWDWFSGTDMVRLTFNEDILQYYCYMYIDKMSPTELKEYIINLLDPVGGLWPLGAEAPEPK